MSVRDVSSTLVKVMFAACAVCAGAESTAAANATDYTTLPHAATVPPAEARSASFAQRFAVAPTSFMRDIRARLIFIEPVVPMTTASLPLHTPRQKIVPAGAAIVGIASSYDPTDSTDRDSGNEETASGERYDPEGWTAAIRTDLRNKFGGVRFGRNYRPVFALVQSGDKQAIVRINDVGPLKRGRIIDLNRRAMHYFDPTLQVGILDKVRVTPLAGQDIALGPVDDRPVSVAGRFGRLSSSAVMPAKAGIQ